MQSMQIKQILFLLIILLAFLIIFGFLIYTSMANAIASEEISPIKRKLIKYENSDITIDADEVIDGDIVINKGSITVTGEIHGNIIAFDADVYLESKAKIFGHIVLYKGEAVRDEQTGVGGDIVLVTDDEVNISECRQLPGYVFRLNTFKGDATIEQDETNYGDLLIFKSELEIDGKVDGCVLNFFGEININEGAAIDGNVISYDGLLDIDDEALITGRTVEIDPEKKRVSNLQRNEEEDQIIREEIERKYLQRDRKKNADIVRFWGDVTIEPDEFIRGDVVTLRGTVHVQGEVDGDVVAVFGSVELDSTAYVDGDVVSVGGKIYREKGAHVNGDLVQTTITGVKVDDGDQHVSVGITGISIGPKKGDEWERKKYRRTGRWNPNIDDEPFMFRYNRVEGLFLGLRLERDDWRDNGSAWFDLYGHAGYGFSRKRGCYQIGLERSIFGKYGPVVGAEAHDIVDSEDEWIIPTFENSLAAFFLREDFQDYYRKEGYSAYVSHDISEYLTLTAEYRKDHHHHLKRKTHWSIFGGDKKFRENPLLDEIEFRSVAATITLDTRNSYKYPDQGWLINLIGEFAGKDLNKNGVDFDRFIVDIRRYQPITYGENLDFRLRAGSSRGNLPAHLKFDLGGISTLRGYKFKEFPDENRMILGNIEYRIHGRRSPFNRMFGWSDFSFILFADAGYIWSVDDTLKAQEGFDDLDWEDIYTSIGFAISNRDGNVRLNFAKRLDEKGEPIVVTFRINRPF
jgi:cytoskeletal protein CcmA (bactofilin family)